MLAAVYPFHALPDVQQAMDDLANVGVLVIAALAFTAGYLACKARQVAREEGGPHRAFRTQRWDHEDAVITEREGHRQP